MWSKPLEAPTHRTGLIEVHDGGVSHEGDGDAEAAFHAAAVLPGLLVRNVVQVHRSQTAVHGTLKLFPLLMAGMQVGRWHDRGAHAAQARLNWSCTPHSDL